jgi:hypothetical protein
MGGRRPPDAQLRPAGDRGLHGLRTGWLSCVYGVVTGRGPRGVRRCDGLQLGAASSEQVGEAPSTTGGQEIALTLGGELCGYVVIVDHASTVTAPGGRPNTFRLG